jgi:methylphosphotriester-DNA--protein-cysteine methyltransferase
VTVDGEQAEEVRLLRMTPLLGAVARHDAVTGDTSTIRAVFINELRRSERARHGVCLPQDPRAHGVAQAVIHHPADPRSLQEFAASSGSSRRTLLRLFTAQTGLTFRQFRQRARIYRSLKLLSGGESVRETELGVGYDSTPVFIAAFGKIMGTTPARYRKNLQDRSVRSCATSARNE